MINYASGDVMPYTKDMSVVKKIKWKKETAKQP